MTKKKLVNSQTDQNVETFIEGVENGIRKADAFSLLKTMTQITGKEARMWGERIIGFGKYSYKRKNGDEFEWFNVGFSPGKAHMTIYVMYDINEEKGLLNDLGPHKTGRGCLYIKRLEQVNLAILNQLISKSDKWQS